MLFHIFAFTIMLPSNLSVLLLRKSNSCPTQKESIEEGERVTLADLCRGRVGVVDFWHTKCTRCPAAIDKLNSTAETFAKEVGGEEVLWITCALSQGEGNVDVVKDLVQDDSWSELNHLFVEENDKELCKSVFGYSAVPFYVVFDRTGRIHHSGEPKSVDILAEIKSLLATNDDGATIISSANNGLAFDDDF